MILPLDDRRRRTTSTRRSYAEGLADLWVAEDGKRYGLPKDWDTVALFYNKKMAADAGITEEEHGQPRPGTRMTAAPSRRPSPS